MNWRSNVNSFQEKYYLGLDISLAITRSATVREN